MAPAPAPGGGWMGGIGDMRQRNSAMVVCHGDAHPILGIMGPAWLILRPCPGIDHGSLAQKADKPPTAPIWLFPAPGRCSRDNFRPAFLFVGVSRAVPAPA